VLAGHPYPLLGRLRSGNSRFQASLGKRLRILHLNEKELDVCVCVGGGVCHPSDGRKPKIEGLWFRETWEQGEEK
jgi:hypothetical protein